MNRTEGKCLLGSAAMHGLLALVFLFGSAFFTPKQKQNTLPVISFIPDVLVDKALFGGGDPKVDPNAKPPPAQPVEPEVKPPPQQPAQPPPPKPEPQEDEPPKKQVARSKPPELKSHDPAPEKSKPKDLAKESTSKISTNLIPIKVEDTAKKKAERDQREYAAKVAAQRQRWDKANLEIGKVVSGLGREISTTTIGVPGPGGSAYANYAQYVKSVYDAAWLVPSDIDDTVSTVKVRITIARDGTIRSAIILSRSANAVINRSVQRALDEVKTIGKSFPEGAREDQRVFEINFNLKARQQLG
jgi:outer membrane biosynthesis protein TonB